MRRAGRARRCACAVRAIKCAKGRDLGILWQGGADGVRARLVGFGLWLEISLCVGFSPSGARSRSVAVACARCGAFSGALRVGSLWLAMGDAWRVERGATGGVGGYPPL